MIPAAVRVVCALTDPTGHDEAGRVLHEVVEHATPNERRMLLVASCRLARALYDAVAPDAPGLLPEPAVPDWADIAGTADPAALSGAVDALTMLTDPADLGTDPKWAGYATAGASPVRTAAAVATALAWAASNATLVAQASGTDPNDLLRLVGDAVTDAA
jgi:hypothetical protein